MPFVVSQTIYNYSEALLGAAEDLAHSAEESQTVADVCQGVSYECILDQVHLE